MHSTPQRVLPMITLLQTIESTWLATMLRTSTWGYPALEIVHILALGTVIGTMVLVDGRLLLGADGGLAREILPVTLAAFALAATTGGLMFAARATDLGYNRALWFKLALIAFAGINAASFHLRGSLQRRDHVARLQAMLSLLTWVAVVCAGRLIAYL